MTTHQNKPAPFENGVRRRLQHCYDGMWTEAIAKIRSGNAELDPVLAAGQPDQRRGLTVITRPIPAVLEKVTKFLEELRALEPDQHYYLPSEFHITLLSLFTATVDHKRFLAKTAQYTAAVDAVLRTAEPIRVEFNGVTASAGAVVIQGYVEDPTLNDLRGDLRRQLRDRGLGEGVDGRYRLETAHITIARFRAPLKNAERFAAALERARQRPFGTTTIRNVSLVQNDWYMTHRTLQTVKRYRLTRPGARTKK